LPRQSEQRAGVLIIRVVRIFGEPIEDGLTGHAARFCNIYLGMIFENHFEQANSAPPTETFRQWIPFSNLRQIPARLLGEDGYKREKLMSTPLLRPKTHSRQR